MGASQALETARSAGRELARAAGDRRRAAVARFVELTPPEARPRAFPEAAAVGDLEDPLGWVAAASEPEAGHRRLEVRVPRGLVLAGLDEPPSARTCALAIAAGNALVLAREDRTVERARRALAEAGLPEASLTTIDANQARAAAARVDAIATADDAQVPAATVAEGHVCHTYVDGAADPRAAVERCVAATRSQRPTATDTFLVHEAVADVFLPELRSALAAEGVALVAGEAARRRIPGVEPATGETWSRDHGPDRAGVRVVGSLGEGLDHVHAYGGGLAEAIETREADAALAFANGVEARHAVANGPSTRAAGDEREPRPLRLPTDPELAALTTTRSVHVPADGVPDDPAGDRLGDVLGRVLARP